MRPITDTLRDLRGGAFAAEATELLAEVVRQVDETGKPGRIVLMLELRRAGGNAVAVIGRVSTKLPPDRDDGDLFYALADGSLSLNNPNQRALDLQPVITPAPRIVAGE